MKEIANYGNLFHLQRIFVVFVIIRIRFQIININSWQSRNQELQLLLVKNGNESLGDHIVKSL